jgi:hypothetical protein
MGQKDKKGDATGRPSQRSSLLTNPNAKFWSKNTDNQEKT